MTKLPLRDDLLGCEPYGAPQLNAAVRINVNENPYPVPKQVCDAIAQAVSKAAVNLNRYPDRDCCTLRGALAKYLESESQVKLSADQIWAANGSNEALTHVFAAFGGSGVKAVSTTPSYSMYPEYARNALCELIQVQRNQDYQIDMPALTKAVFTHKPAIIILASPNNPTGTQLEQKVIKEVLNLSLGNGPKGSDAVVVIDEAYAEFRRPGRPTALELLESNHNLIVSRTMSKAFAMAGLRLGYLAASEQIVDYMRIVRLPYHLSSLTQAAAIAALDHAPLLQAEVAKIRQQRDLIVEVLRSQGLEVATSDANFVMFGRFRDAHSVWQGLVERSILIREVPVPGFLRASVGTEEENEAFLAALKAVLEYAG